MSRQYPIPIDDRTVGASLYFAAGALKEVERLLRTYGTDEESHEGIVYLGGLEIGDRAVVTTALSPTARTSFGSFQTGTKANQAVVVALRALRLTLVGQVHSHPGRWVDHSDGDDAGALVRFEGYWSLVVPMFARDGMQPMHACGVHQFQQGMFRRLSDAAVEARIYVSPASLDLRLGAAE